MPIKIVNFDPVTAGPIPEDLSESLLINHYERYSQYKRSWSGVKTLVEFKKDFSIRGFKYFKAGDKTFIIVELDESITAWSPRYEGFVAIYKPGLMAGLKLDRRRYYKILGTWLNGRLLTESEMKS